MSCSTPWLRAVCTESSAQSLHGGCTALRAYCALPAPCLYSALRPLPLQGGITSHLYPALRPLPLPGGITSHLYPALRPLPLPGG
jgi:hypothetical protein